MENKIKLIVVHCSDTPDDKFLRALDIHKMHLSFGWNGIGYHEVILRDGTIEKETTLWNGAQR